MTATRYRVVHQTQYEYSQPMSDGYTLGYLLPRPTPQQVVESAIVEVDPAPDERAEHIDAFGNRVVQFGVHHQHESLTVTSRSEIVFEPAVLFDDGMPWELVVEAVSELRGGAALQVRPFAGGVPQVWGDDVDRLLALVARAFTPGRPIVDAARAWCRLIFDEFEYDKTFTDLTTPLTTVLSARRGVCQDFAHVAVTGLRLLGLAARYVSGYMETDPPPGQPRLVGADASHAWCSVWVPGTGWVDFDPTNNRLPVHRHVTVAWGRDYSDVPPVRGVVIGPSAVQTLAVSVDVARLD